MKNRLIIILTLLVVAGGTAPLSAQSAPSSQGKIGVINIQAAIAGTAEGKKAFSDLQKKYEPRQQELQRLQQEIQAIQDKLTKQEATLSEDEQSRLSRDAEDKQKLLKRSSEDAQNDFTRDRDEAINQIGKKMVHVITDYAQQNGFALVMDDAQTPIYFAAKDIELTAEIVKRYDATNPVANAGAPGNTPASSATPANKSK